MPKYLLEVRYGPDGVQALLDKGGTARKTAAAALAKSLGGKLETFYFALGEVDAYAIVDMPDVESATAAALTVSASGSVSLRTIALLTPAEVDAAADKKVSYKPPGR